MLTFLSATIAKIPRRRRVIRYVDRLASATTEHGCSAGRSQYLESDQLNVIALTWPSPAVVPAID
jgi:ribose 1,5-bisphosphokinase PhnN